MSYVVRVKKKAFSKSAQRMLDTVRYYEYEKQETAHMVAKTLLRGPNVISAKVYKEDEADG